MESPIESFNSELYTTAFWEKDVSANILLNIWYLGISVTISLRPSGVIMLSIMYISSDLHRL